MRQPRVPRGLGVAALVVLLSSVSAAQQPVPVCTPSAKTDFTTRKIAHLNLRPTGEQVRLPLATAERKRLATLLQFVQEGFAPPDSIPLRPSVPDLFGSADAELTTLYSPSIEGMILFRAHSDGRVTDLRVVRSSGAASLDSAVLAALRRSAEVDQIGMLGFDYEDDQSDDTLRSAEFVLSLSTDPDSLAATHPLVALTVGLYVIRQAFVRRDNAPPPYPERLRKTGKEGHVLTTFIVDGEGRPEPGSLRIIESNDPEFTRAVRDHVPTMRYLPAEVGGCGMRMWVQQPFDFKMRR